MVLDADAVVEPWTVMVVALYALVTDWTVSAARRPNDHAVRAYLDRVYQLHELEEVKIFYGLDLPTIASHSSDPQDDADDFKYYTDSA